MMENSSVNGHFNLMTSLISRSSHQMNAAAAATGPAMRRETSSPLLNDSDRSNEADLSRNVNQQYLDSYNQVRSAMQNNLQQANFQHHQTNSNSPHHHQQQQPQTQNQQHSQHNMGPGPMNTNSPPLHRNHPYQRSDSSPSSNPVNTNNNSSNPSQPRNPAEMTLNEYNRSEGTPEEMLRRAPLKIRSSEALSAIPSNLPVTSSDTTTSLNSNYILNPMIDGSDAYRMALKQEPETGY